MFLLFTGDSSDAGAGARGGHSAAGRFDDLADAVAAGQAALEQAGPAGWGHVAEVGADGLRIVEELRPSDDRRRAARPEGDGDGGGDGQSPSSVEVIIEIVKGSRNKYEMDHATGVIRLDRMLFTATQYPADYGFVPDTLAEDGDPLDALVLLEESTFPGCHITARPVGVFWMRDEQGPDAKILCVPATDPRWASTVDVEDLQPHLLDEIGHFFDVYKDLEPGKRTETRGWENAARARAEVSAARARFAAPPSHGHGEHA